MKLRIAFLTGALGVLATALMAPLPARAQTVTFPPLVRVIVPFAAGAGTDVIARAVAAQMGGRLGTNVIVENRVGASGMIGTGAVARGPKDGSTLLFHSASLITTAATARSVPFDTVNDLVPVAIVADGPLLVGIAASAGIKTPAELVARAKGASLTAGSAGVGTIGHLTVELLNEAAKIQIRHIPYKGAAQALVDVAAGTIDLLIATYSSMAPQVKSGRVIPIAVTSPQPSAAYPGIPSMASAAPGYNPTIWYGMFAPAGLPPAMLARLNRDVNDIARSNEVRELSKADGAEPVIATPEELARRVRDDFAMWKRLATEKNIVVD